MKKLILTIMLIAPIILMAQNGNYTLNGKVSNLSAPAKAYLIYDGANKTVMDSSVMQNGQFKFKGTAYIPLPATILINRTGSGIYNITNEKLIVYLESGNITVNSPDSLAKAKISGSKINDDNKKLTLAMKPNELKLAAFNAAYYARSDEEKKDKAAQSVWHTKAMAIRKEKNQILLTFIKENPNSFVSLTSLMAYSSFTLNYVEALSLFHTLSTKVKNTNMGKEFLVNTKNTIATAIGAIAPAFMQNDPEGKPIKLSDFKGKYVLIDFWASWCGPCRAENPNVLKAYATYHDKGLEILGVSLDEKKAPWIKAIADDKLIWKHVSDLKGFKNQVAVLYAIGFIPQNVLVDPTGKIMAKNLRGDALGKKLAEILK